MIARVANGLKVRARTAWQSSHVLGSLPAGVRFALWAKNDRVRRWQGQSGNYSFLMRWGDWPSVQEVLIEHEYKIINECLKGKASPVVLDLGANIGTFSLYIFQNFPKARVVAYEPGKEIYALLEATHKLNSGLDWTIHQAAVWREDGSVSFNTTEYSHGSRVITTGSETVPAVSFVTAMAGLPAGPIDLVKVDVEGAEEAVLLGHEAELARIEHLIIELHPGRCDTDKVLALLRQSYAYIYFIPDRGSTKPLLLCARRAFNLPLFS